MYVCMYVCGVKSTQAYTTITAIPPGLAHKIDTFRPLAEPIRFQDSQNSTCSRTEKKIILHHDGAFERLFVPLFIRNIAFVIFNELGNPI